MDLGLRGKLAVVTGASRGIGRAIASELAREGARLALVARDKPALERLRRELPGSSRRHAAFAADLMAAAGPARLAQAVLKRLGPPEVVVHNLGGSLGIQDGFAPVSDWRKVWQYNLGIAVELNASFLPPMIERGWGRVVHLSTLSTTTFNGSPPYVAAKAAVDAYVKTIGRQVARHGVIVSAAAPGAVLIEGRHFARLQKEDPAALQEYYRHHLLRGRLETPEEIAPLVAFLCSEQASPMTGSVVAVDGGGH